VFTQVGNCKMPDTFGSIEYGYGCYFAFNTTKKNN